MVRYDNLKAISGNRVSQTIDSPITIFDHWELSDAFIALTIVMIFGVLFYSWFTMFSLLVVFLGIGPVIKKNNERGIFLHWPYAKIGVSLPGLINPQGRKRYSD